MDRMALTKALIAAGVGDTAVSFTEKNERYCVLEDDGRWCVTYNERGMETYRMEFSSEDAACRHLFGVLTHAKA